MLRRYEAPYMADWFAISLRWVMLVGLIVSLGLGGRLDAPTSWPLGLMILWNLLMTALAGMNARMTYHRRISLFVDLLLAGAFYWVQGGIRGPAFWVGLLPILTGSIYYEIRGAFIAAVLFAAFVFYTGTRVEGQIPFAAAIAAFMAILGLVFGFLGRRLIKYMRMNREIFLGSEEKKGAMQSERLRAIYELTSTLSSTLSYKRVLESALDMSATALNPDPEQLMSDPLVGAVMLFNGGKLRVGSARRLTSADMRVTFDGAEGVLKKALDEGEPVVFKDIGYDPELGRVIALRGCTSGYCFPLRSGFNVYGVLLFAHPDPKYFCTRIWWKRRSA